MKNLFSIIILFSLVSCGSLHKLKKSHTSKSDSTVTTKVDSSTYTKTVSSTTLTEKADSTISGKKDSAQVESKLTDLQNGDTSTINTGTIQIKTFLDKKTGAIKTKVNITPPPTHFSFSKTIVSNVNQTKKTDLKKSSNTEVKTETKDSSKAVERKGGGFKIGFSFGILISLLFLLIILYLVLRKRLKIIFPFLP